MATRKVRRLLWTVVVCALFVLGVKAFVGDVYHVSSSSMEPTLGEDCWVFVRHDDSPPRRYEVVVVKHQGNTLVKRAVGIGGAAGESLLIDGSGDVMVNGAYVVPDIARPDPILLFDDRLHAVSDHFARGDGECDPWTENEDGSLRLDATQVPEGSDAGLLRFHRHLHDDYFASDGSLIEGIFDVHDAVVDFEFRALEAAGQLRAVLVEQGDTFEFTVDLSQPGMAMATLSRTTPTEVLPLSETSVPFELETWTRVRFANVDNHLTVEWGSRDRDEPPVAETSYDFNNTHPSDQRMEGKNFGERVAVGGAGCRIDVRRLRIYRDLHWTQQGEHAVGARVEVPPGKIFLLGDNSAESLDSRQFGSLPVDQILGRPVYVVWPPWAFRRL